MSKLDKFFKAKDSKKEKDQQQNVPKPTAEDAEELQKFMQGEFVVSSEISGKTLTLTKGGVAMYAFYVYSSTFSVAVVRGLSCPQASIILGSLQFGWDWNTLTRSYGKEQKCPLPPYEIRMP